MANPTMLSVHSSDSVFTSRAPGTKTEPGSIAASHAEYLTQPGTQYEVIPLTNCLYFRQT